MEKYWELITALQEGHELSNKANWKNSAMRMTFFLALIHGVLGFLPVEVSNGDVHLIANGLDAMFGVFVMYVTAATSKSVGIKTTK
jgi:hypothetical protein